MDGDVDQIYILYKEDRMQMPNCLYFLNFLGCLHGAFPSLYLLPFFFFFSLFNFTLLYYSYILTASDIVLSMGLSLKF